MSIQGRSPMRAGILFLLAMALAAGPQESKIELRIGGSTALAPLVEQAAHRYSAQHPNVRIVVERSGSKAAMEALAAGRLHMALSDVAARPGKQGEEYQVSHLILQAFVFVSHPQVPTSSLSVEEARDFFLKEGAVWGGSRGGSLPVVPMVRGRESGTAEVQRRLAIGGNREFGAFCKVYPSTEKLLRAIETTPGAVGFVELSNAIREGAQVKVLAYDGVVCSAQTVKGGAYPLLDLGRAYHRPAHLPKPVLKEIQAFIAFVRDPDFQLESAFGQGGFPVQWYRDIQLGVSPKP